MDAPTAEFERHRARLFGIAYRMLGTRSDAEDIVQEAYIRWHDNDSTGLRSSEAWLVTVVTRLALDRLRAASAERRRYVGPWLPEPLVAEDPTATPESHAELASSLSVAFVALLERLAPEERAAFLLHDVFDHEYAEIARILGKSEAACRQMVHRARDRVRAERPRFETNEEEQRRLLAQFRAAMLAVDEDALRALFAPDATLTSDGGGAPGAARKPIVGGERVARLFAGVARKSGLAGISDASVNGEPGLILHFPTRDTVLTATVAGGRITAVFHVINPDKLPRGDHDVSENQRS